MDLESRGLPSGFIASCEFEQAADAQGKSLGIKPNRVFVPHPIHIWKKANEVWFFNAKEVDRGC